MISPELLRRFPFFGPLSDPQLKEIAMISEELHFSKGKQFFEECQPADNLYLLVEGDVDLFIKFKSETKPGVKNELFAGDINPGEVFGISSIIEPYVLSATARAAKDGTVIKIDAKQLRTLFQKDHELAVRIMSGAAKIVMERLLATRIQLAAASTK